MRIIRQIAMFIIIISLISAQNWESLDPGTNLNLNDVDFSNPQIGLIACEGGVILKTADGGETWLSIPTEVVADLSGISMISQEAAVAVGNGGTIIRTEDGGASWTTVPTPGGISYDLYSISITANGIGTIGGAAQTILVTDDGGINWSIYQTDMFGGGFWGAQMVTDQIGFVFGENSIFAPLIARTLDGGVNWLFDTFYLEDGAVLYEGRLIDGYFFNEHMGLTAAHRWDGWGCISRTEDFNNWETDHFNGFPLNAVDFFTGDIGFVVGNTGRIYRTEDGGFEWELDPSGTDSNLSGVRCVQESVCFACGENGSLLQKAFIPEGVLGDVNNDGMHDILDIVRMVNIILGNPPEPTYYELWAGDLNGDDNLNILDVIALLNIIVEP